MDDKAFDALKLKGAVVPQQARWPAPETLHWMRLHEVADEARKSVDAVFTLIDEIDKDPDLSPQGRERQRRRVATQAIADIQASKTLENARVVVARVMLKWEQQVGMTLKSPADPIEATLHWEVRDRFASLKDQASRMSFLEKHASDPMIASALLKAPAGLVELSDAERAMVRIKVETHVPPDVIEMREKTAKALREAERGWERAQAVIAQRAGLVKGADGSWSEPDAKAAAA